MFFAPFDEVERNQQSNFVSFYSKLTFFFKFFFIVSLAFVIHNLITLNGLFFANIPSVTFPYNEYWRIFTAPFATLDGLYGVVSIIISFWWLCSLFPGYEKKYSSIHLFLQVFMQNLIIQMSYSLIVAILVRNTYFYETYNDYFFSIGWIPLLIIWIFKFTGQNKQEKVNFCFLPFLVKNKYLAWILSVFIIILTIQKTPLIVATLLGAIQFHLFERSVIRLPMCIHLILEKPFLPFARCLTTFVPVSQCRVNLQHLLKGKKTDEFVQQASMTMEQKNKSGLFGNDDLTNMKKPSQVQLKSMEGGQAQGQEKVMEENIVNQIQ